MTASTSAGDIELTSSGDTATTLQPPLSKENAFPTVASLRSTPLIPILLHSSAHVSLNLEPENVPAIIPPSILGNAYLRARRDMSEAIPIDATSELPSTSSVTRCGCHSYMLRKSVHTTRLVPRNDQKKTEEDSIGYRRLDLRDGFPTLDR